MMANKPLVSVVITAYNDEKTIAQAIDSALAQDYEPKEIIVVLDGPRDQTAQVAAKYAAQVRLVAKENGGTASARNRGIEEARGEWIQFLDADDIMLPQKISASLAQLAHIANPQSIALIFTSYYQFLDQGDNLTLFSVKFAEDWSREKLLHVPGHVHPDPLIRRAALQEVGGYSKEYLYAEDTEMYHRLALKYQMLAVRAVHLLYRRSLSQKTQVMKEHQQGNLLVSEPARITQRYEEEFARQIPMWAHPFGLPSQRLAIYGGTPDSADWFCADATMQTGENSGVQHIATTELNAILHLIAQTGFAFVDFLGFGAENLAQLANILSAAGRETGLRFRLALPPACLADCDAPRLRILLQQFLEAGVEDFLLDFHEQEAASSAAVVEGPLAPSMLSFAARQFFDENDCSYCLRVVVNARNYRNLPSLAQKLCETKARLINFYLSPYTQKAQLPPRPAARFRDFHPYLQEATKLLIENGQAVNIHHAPFCALLGLERHLITLSNKFADPYEPQVVLSTSDLSSATQLIAEAGQQLTIKPAATNLPLERFGLGCEICWLRKICDGVDEEYTAHLGWQDFEPVTKGPQDPPLENPHLYRWDNPRAQVLSLPRAARSLEKTWPRINQAGQTILKIKDLEFRHAQYSSMANDSKFVQWYRGDDEHPLTIFTDRCLGLVEKSTSRYNIAWLVESPAIHPQAYDYIRHNFNRFDRVFTCSEELLKVDARIIFCPYGCSFVPLEKFEITPKSKMCSLIASDKQMVEGQRLRHQAVAVLREEFAESLEIMGRGYRPFADKREGLAPYRYSIVIENVRQNHYFTEKLIDALSLGTVPIYWGPPAIDKFFDVRGLILFEKIEELPEILRRLSVEDYQARLPYIKNNWQTCRQYLSPEDWMFEKVLRFFIAEIQQAQ